MLCNVGAFTGALIIGAGSWVTFGIGPALLVFGGLVFSSATVAAIIARAR